MSTEAEWPQALAPAGAKRAHRRRLKGLGVTKRAEYALSGGRGLLNVGADLSAEDFAGLALEHGFDTFITSPDAGDAFIQEVVPRVRELVADARGSG